MSGLSGALDLEMRVVTALARMYDQGEGSGIGVRKGLAFFSLIFSS